MFLLQMDLSPGDVIEIKYRVLRNFGRDEHTIDRWLTAEIVSSDPGTWPLARLADGQVTEVRNFMSWRHVPGGRRPRIGLAA